MTTIKEDGWQGDASKSSDARFRPVEAAEKLRLGGCEVWSEDMQGAERLKLWNARGHCESQAWLERLIGTPGVS